MKKLIALALSVLAFAFTQVAFAGSVGPWVGNLTPLGSVAYYGGNNYGKAQATLGAGSRWNPDILASTQNGVNVVQNVALPVGAGVAKTALSGVIGPLQVLATMGAVLGSPAVAIVSSVVLIPGVLDWLMKVNVRPNPTSTGYETKDPKVCTTAPCYEYTVTNNGNPDSHSLTQDAACNAFASSMNTLVPGAAPWVAAGVSGSDSLLCNTLVGQSQDKMSWQITPTGAAPQDAPWKPTNYDEFKTRLSGVPISVDLLNRLIAAGYTFPLDGQSVTGPASIAAPPTSSTSTTINNAGDNITTTTTNNTISNQTYGTSTDPATGKSAPTVNSTTTTTTTTNVFNNTTNQTVSSTVSVDKKPDTLVMDKLNTDEKIASTDTALPDAPKLYKQKYPDGFSGVWKAQRDLIAATPLFSAAQNLMPSVSRGGTCPRMPINLTFSSWANYGVKDVAPPCEVWDWGKAIIIVSALLLARRMIFGG